MALVVPDGVLQVFQDLFNPTLSSAILHLYSNNHTPVNTDDITDYTESTAPGYAAITLPAIVPPAGAPVASVVTKTWLAQVFSFTGGPDNIYGYYVTDATDTELLWAERYGFAPFVTANGLTFTVDPNLQLTVF